METTEKVSIGKPNSNRVKRILSHYENITESLNSVKWGIDDLYKDFEPVPLEYLLEILKSEKPADLLKRRFAEMRGISIQGLSTEKLVGSNLIDIPESKLENILKYRNELFKRVALLQNENYCIPLSELYVGEGVGVFTIYDDIEGQDVSIRSTGLFEARIIKDLSIFSETEQEKLVVEKLQNLCDAINDLVEMEVLPQDARCLKIEFFLTPTLEVDRTEKRPAMLSQQIFRAARLKRFASNSNYRTTVNFDMNKFLS